MDAVAAIAEQLIAQPDRFVIVTAIGVDWVLFARVRRFVTRPRRIRSSRFVAASRFMLCRAVPTTNRAADSLNQTRNGSARS